MTGKRKVNYSESEEHSSDEDFISEDVSIHSKTRGSTIESPLVLEPPKKRGRGPSKRPCTNRNALMARVNRQRKKEYLESIEGKLNYYRNANKNLANVVQQQGIDLKRLTAEVSYLRNILNNNTSITTLLKTMNESLKQRKCRPEEDKWDLEKTDPISNSLGLSKTSARVAGGPETLGDSEIPSDPGNNGNDIKYQGTLLSLVESDHNYSNGIITNDLFDFEGVNCDPFKGSLAFPSGNPNIINSTEDSQFGISDVDIDQLGNLEIFDLPGDAGGDGIDLSRSDQPQTDNLFDNLDNSGY
ncbi:uncharacterized protein [Fopius arisanus]|uniref:Uncharacterized protein isoform X2 n=1 Tax=Fopius arisanus TaxID=64838 RepID=A0A9R1TFZ7_9HYME|nr:PREDICTED: uncharacterized protein LOC105269609 isoform X2 [Fopius arisanus]